MIDCDVHIEIGDREGFLAHVDAGQRDWFRAQGPLLGTAPYLWAHPGSWYRDELALGPAGEPASTVEDVVREVLDEQGADVAILTGDYGVATSLITSAYRAAAFARAHNDWLREEWLEADPRFRGSILVPAQDPVAAAAEIRRAGADPRFVQVLLCGGSERPYGDPRYLPLLEACAELDLALAVHSGAEGLGLAAPPGGAGMPTFYIEWHTLGSACSIMAHLVSLLCHGSFERVPGLRVLLLEGGLAWLPGILWRLDANWRGLREETPWLRERPSETMRRHVRFTTQPLEHTDGRDELLTQMLAAAGAPDILCYASDYPHWDYDEPAQLLRRLPESWRAAVLHDNAAAFYGARLGAVPA